MKALKNFTCNGVRKKAGDLLSKEELVMLGDLKGGLVKDDFLQMGESKKEEKEEEKAELPVEPEMKDDLCDLDREGLMKYAKDLGLNPHHNCGEEKLREMVRKKLEA